jgi:uncharacterized protein (DUF433 family)
VPIRIDQHGTARVGKTRVTLDLVIEAYKNKSTPEEIVEYFPSLELKDVYGAITYYLYNQEEVEAYLAEQKRIADEIERESRAIWEATDFYKRAKAIKDQRAS